MDEYVRQDYRSTRASRRWLSGAVGLSRFEAQNDRDACDGCQDCIERCRTDALVLEEVPGQKKMKVAVDAVKCTGCGVCVFVCGPRSLKMTVVRPPGQTAIWRTRGA